MRQPIARPTLPILADLPSGYFVDEAPGGVLAVRVDYAEALRLIGFGPETDGDAAHESDLHGRQPLSELRLPKERLVLRRFSHGGLMRWATGSRFLDAERPFRELILADALAKSRIPTLEVVAARARFARGGGWLLDLCTRRLEGSLDLGEVLERVGRGELGDGARGQVATALGGLLRRLHGFGLLHADLQPRNLLVLESDLAGAEEQSEVPIPIWVIDLDRSAFVGDLSEGERRSNLRRLFRAIDRRDKQGGRFLRRTDFVRFFRAYDASGNRWKSDWRQIMADHARNGPAHWVGQVFERVFAADATKGRRLGG
ncbi:MAG: lipopolysaccharide kinase InaA family protein [Planctomycetota bacterium]|nr:lipopolysaccharide kinase InaA family protein [Planctomycetota bacterium]